MNETKVAIMEKQSVISRQKIQLGITGSAAIWYKTDNIRGKNEQTAEKRRTVAHYLY